jgi:effector-binding domain-containing protein
MSHRIRAEERDAILAISRRQPVMLAGIGPALGEAFGQLYGHLAMRGVDPAGPPFVIYHSEPVPDLPLDIEVCAPIAAPTDAPAGCSVGYVPGGTFATLVHRGPYETISGAYEELAAWAGRHHRELVGPPRETYLSEPDTRPADIRTIVEWPVSAARMPVGAKS